jgi:hypothetical protein
MTVIFPLLLLVVFFAVVALTFSDGIWNNAVRFVNMVTAGLLAVNFWEPVARMVEGWGGFIASLSYFLDFLCFWFLFAAFMGIFRVLTAMFSKTKVKFLKVFDQVGGLVLSMVVAWTMVCITAFSIHMAPVAKTAFGGGLDPNTPMMWGLRPDTQWLFFAVYTSGGPFSRTMSDEDFSSGAYGNPLPGNAGHVAAFGLPLPHGNYPTRYLERRTEVEELSKSDTVRVDEAKVKKR